MTRWAAFAGVTLAVLVLLLLLARASTHALSGGGGFITRRERRWLDGLEDGATHLDVSEAPKPREMTPAESTLAPADSVPTLALLANVAVSHALFALLLLGGIWLTGVPLPALGVSADPLSTGVPAVVLGIALGLALSFANTLAGGLARAFGADPSEELRGLLAPQSAVGWIVLLVVVLPIIAGFEELLFRAALVGVFAVGFEFSPWLLAVLSSVAFAAGHGAQGPLGVLVTGMLGFVLAVAFVLTNSLLVVVVAHYVVNAVEFVVFEGVGWEPFGT